MLKTHTADESILGCEFQSQDLVNVSCAKFQNWLISNVLHDQYSKLFNQHFLHLLQEQSLPQATQLQPCLRLGPVARKGEKKKEREVVIEREQRESKIYIDRDRDRERDRLRVIRREREKEERDTPLIFLLLYHLFYFPRSFPDISKKKSTPSFLTAARSIVRSCGACNHQTRLNQTV